MKKRLQHEDIQEDEKNALSKPLVHNSQEIKLRRIVKKYAKQDEHVLFNFLNLVQNMLRGKLYES